MHLVDSTTSTFSLTPQELRRLAVYRAAVAAGFYTDWDGSAQELDTDALAWLHRQEGVVEGEAFPFTPDERQHLETCRAALEAGQYADDVPPGSPAGPPEQPTP
jgi:hypothetical protein